MAIFLFIPQNQTTSIINLKKRTIAVEIKGEVKNPGVYQLENGSTLEDLLAMVQLEPQADISSLNQTMLLANHDVIVIKEKSEKKKISINAASKEELMQITGVGEKTAEKIIEYRQNHGPFQKIEDLLNVNGIGEKKLEKMKELICL